MTNVEIAKVFARVAQLLSLKEENPFRIRAYERASQTIGSLSREVKEILKEGGEAALEEIPGIGRDLALKMGELVKTGKLVFLAEFEKKIPKGLLGVMEVEGMGPKKTAFVWKKFQVKSVADLEKLGKSGKLGKLKGWGEKSVANILRGIETRRKMGGRLPVGEALPLAEEIVESLRKSGLCKDIEVAGSLRRRSETIGDIDILVTSRHPGKVMDVFCALAQVERVVAKGPTKSTVFLKAGLDADLRVVEPDLFGAALYYFTGSKAHNVHVRARAVKKGITISEYGVYKGTAEKKGRLIAARTEEDVLRAAGLPYIPPELREDRGEIEAALKGELPKLLEQGDLCGDLHMHSAFSDGAASMTEMATSAKDAGLEYIAITDHASPMGMVKGIKKENIGKYLKLIEEAKRRVPGIRILAGTEVDILEDGELFLPDDILRRLDWVVASVHQNFKQSSAQMTERLLRAVRNPYVCVLGHPTTRLLGKRPGVEFDADAVFREAAKLGVALELNASMQRLDLSDVHCRRARELGAKIVINSDAHNAREFDMRFGIAQARRGWLEKEDVLNTLPWKKFEQWLKKK